MVRMALIVGLLAVSGLGLTGCGRKAGLDPPPSAQTTTQSPVIADDQVTTYRGAAAPADPSRPEPVPAPPPSRNRTFPLDPLLN